MTNAFPCKTCGTEIYWDNDLWKMIETNLGIPHGTKCFLAQIKKNKIPRKDGKERVLWYHPFWGNISHFPFSLVNGIWVELDEYWIAHLLTHKDCECRPKGKYISDSSSRH